MGSTFCQKSIHAIRQYATFHSIFFGYTYISNTCTQSTTKKGLEIFGKWIDSFILPGAFNSKGRLQPHSIQRKTEPDFSFIIPVLLTGTQNCNCKSGTVEAQLEFFKANPVLEFNVKQEFCPDPEFYRRNSIINWNNIKVKKL